MTSDWAMVPPGRDFIVSTASRLHFGLLDTVAPFGGAGMMLSGPQTEIMFQKSSCFEVSGPAADDQCKERIHQIAWRWQQATGSSELPFCKVSVIQRPEPHTGLGTGTQLAMAVAEGLALSMRNPLEFGSPLEPGNPLDLESLATKIAGRGLRSAVGIHGYFRGGFIYEASQHGQALLNPIATRIAVPDDWRVVVWRPRQCSEIVAGSEEVAKFAELPRPSETDRSSLRAQLVNEVIPALQSNQFNAWATAITEYNRSSGMFFAAAQGGPYNGAAISNFINDLRTEGVLGTGQSSWGPSVFALANSEESALRITELANNEWEPLAIYAPCNTGRRIALLD